MAGRVPTLVEYLQYGTTPPYFKILISEPYFLLRLFVGPATIVHFRLQGPGAKPDFARSTIESYPFP
jgi:hypothetical protein